MEHGKLVVDTPGARRLRRAELKEIPTPDATDTFKPVPYWRLIDTIEEALAYRRIKIEADEYCVAKQGGQFFSCLELSITDDDVRFALGIRSSNDKSLRISMVAGFRIFVCSNLAFNGSFQPLLQKHSKNLELQDSLAVALDRTARHFDKLPAQIKAWKEREITDTFFKEFAYDAFVGGGLKIPIRHIRDVHRNYYEDDRFPKGTMWALHNSGTSCFKQLEPDKQYAVTAQWGKLINAVSQ
ncbi:MAG: DUF932 domain-containing protein [Blastocatellales bacterium]